MLTLTVGSDSNPDPEVFEIIASITFYVILLIGYQIESLILSDSNGHMLPNHCQIFNIVLNQTLFIQTLFNNNLHFVSSKKLSNS